MDLDLFRGVVPFVVVAEEQSFRKAAARLGVSPAAVSKAVATLEREVGLSLCARGSRAVTLTREGEIFFESSRAAVTAVMGARALVEGARARSHAGELVVSVPSPSWQPRSSRRRSRSSGPGTPGSPLPA